MVPHTFAGWGQYPLLKHGVGYTVFEHHSQGLKQQVRCYAPPDAPVKIVRLRLENTWQRTRRITATFYAEWNLGSHRDITQQYFIPEYDPDSQVILARNPYRIEFGERVAFCATNKPLHGLTADRTEFLERNGSYRHPAGLKRIDLGSRVEPGEAQEIVFVLSQGENRDVAIELATLNWQIDQADLAWEETRNFWKNTLDSIAIRTPNIALNTILP